MGWGSHIGGLRCARFVLCAGFGDWLYEVEGMNMDELPWPVNVDQDYDNACRRSRV